MHCYWLVEIQFLQKLALLLLGIYNIYENNTEFISNFVSVLRLDAKSLSSHSVELLTVAVEEILKEILYALSYFIDENLLPNCPAHVWIDNVIV